MVNIEILESEIKHLIHLYERASTLSAKNRYYNSISCLTDIYTDLTKKKYFFIPRVKDILYHNHFEKVRYDILIDEISAKEYRNVIEKICANGTKIIIENQNLEDYYFENKIDYQTACEIIYSFFRIYDESLIPFVKNILQNNVFFCNYDIEKLGYSVNIRALNKSYIAIFTDENKISIEMLVTLIHEIGHVIYNKTLENRRYDITYNNFFEVISYYFEEVFKDFCIKNNIYSKDCLKSQKNNINYLHHSLEQLRIINQFIEKIRFNSKDLTLRITKDDFKQIDYLDIDNKPLTLDNCDLTYAYTFGFLLSFYYLKLYQNDPEKTKKLINQFMLGIGVYEDMYIFNNFGLNYSELIKCEFLKPIIIENQKQLTKTTQI